MSLSKIIVVNVVGAEAIAFFNPNSSETVVCAERSIAAQSSIKISKKDFVFVKSVEISFIYAYLLIRKGNINFQKKKQKQLNCSFFYDNITCGRKNALFL